MKVVPLQLELGEFVVGYFDGRLIQAFVYRGFDLQAGAGLRAGNEVHDGLVGDQRTPAPVLRDEAEQAMLDLVPFARAWREVADEQAQLQFIGEHLQ